MRQPNPSDRRGVFAAGAPRAGRDPALTAVLDIARSRDALHQTMVEVATSAAEAIGAADGAGATLMSGPAVLMTAGSVGFVTDVDALQYGLGEGPCLSAVAERRTMWTGSLGHGETRWPRFESGAVRLGVHSVASFPLVLADEVIGSINSYAYDADAFDLAALERGEAFADTAVVAVHNAQVQATTELLQTQLRQSLSERAVLESAVGVLMFRGAISAVEAHDHLRQIAALHHLPLPVVAQVILTDAAVWSGNARRVVASADLPETEADLDSSDQLDLSEFTSFVESPQRFDPDHDETPEPTAS